MCTAVTKLGAAYAECQPGVGCRGSAGTGSGLRVGKGQQDSELRSALHLLSRNVGALLAHTAGPTLHKLPPDLSVFAKLESKSPLQAHHHTHV